MTFSWIIATLFYILLCLFSYFDCCLTLLSGYFHFILVILQILSYYYDLIVLRLYSPNYYFYSYPGSIHTIWVPSKTVTALFIYTPALCFHPHSSLYTSALLWQVQLSENLLPLLDSVQVFRFLGNTRRDLLWHFNPTCFSRVTED